MLFISSSFNEKSDKVDNTVEKMYGSVVPKIAKPANRIA